MDNQSTQKQIRANRFPLYEDHKQNHTKANSWWLLDARGIECCRVCNDTVRDEAGNTSTCFDRAKAQYNPWVFGEGTENYEEECADHGETVDPDGDSGCVNYGFANEDY